MLVLEFIEIIGVVMADDVIEFVETAPKEIVETGVEPPKSLGKENREFSTLEGFDTEISILDKVIRVREMMMENLHDDFVKGKLSSKETEVFNQVLTSLSSDVLSKVKLIKDVGLQEAKNNNESALIGLAMSLIGDRNKVVGELKNMEVKSKQLEVKTLNEHEFLEEEIKKD